MKIGADLMYDRIYKWNNGNARGSFTFSGGLSGYSFVDFLLGLPATVTRIEPYPTQYDRFRDWAGYAQDDFKVNGRLTLIYGLRCSRRWCGQAQTPSTFSGLGPFRSIS